MLGIIIGVVASIGLLTFFSKDPQSVRKHKLQQQKQQKEKEAEEAKLEQYRQKMINDPKAIERREQKKNQIKQKMFKNLSQSQRKTLDQFISEKREEGKSDEQIMKQAGTKAFLLFFMVVLVTIVCIVAVFVLVKGDSTKFMQSFDTVKAYIWKFLTWNFPKIQDLAPTASEDL